ncbi:MAG: outer membrane beta-barrel protein [Saprospiraceae bacterium]
MSKNKLLLFSFMLLVAKLTAEPADSLKIKYSGYLEFFYANDFYPSLDRTRQAFLVTHNRRDLVGLNLATVSAALSKNKWRGKFTAQAGTFPTDNYVTKADKALRFVQEASIGYAIDPGQKIWIDAGVMPSHLGYETAYGIDNWSASRSLASELSPYFISGAKISYQLRKMTLTGLIFNSWDQIYTYKKGQLPSIGTQIMYQRNKNTLINWSTTLGSASHDAFNDMRAFSNFFVSWQSNPKEQFIASVDIGVQKTATYRGAYRSWFTPSLLYRRKINRDWYTSIRAEYFFDEFEAVTKAVDGFAFDLAGISCNVDYLFTENGMIRLEARLLHASGPYFPSPTEHIKNNRALLLTINKKF